MGTLNHASLQAMTYCWRGMAIKSWIVMRGWRLLIIWSGRGVAFGVEVKGGHAWYCLLSLRHEEGMLTDEQWSAIARDFVAAMELDDSQGTKAPRRWAAIRHGVSKNGNDNIHVVVSPVREDAAKASTHLDFRRAQCAARTLEIRHGLESLEPSTAERSTRGWHPTEREAQARSKAKARHEKARSRGTGVWPSWEQLTGLSGKLGSWLRCVGASPVTRLRCGCGDVLMRPRMRRNSCVGCEGSGFWCDPASRRSGLM